LKYFNIPAAEKQPEIPFCIAFELLITISTAKSGIKKKPQKYVA
jgi:hypothetical protein